MAVGVDIDEVLADMNSALIEFYNKKYGISLKRNDFNSYNLAETLGCDDKGEIEIINRFFSSRYFKEIRPVDGAIEGIDFLKKNHDLYAVTGRPESVHEETLRWMNLYFGKKFKDIIFAKNQNSFKYPGNAELTKADYCIKLGIGSIIEDCFSYAKECADKGIRAYLIDYPWNQSDDDAGVIRVASWKDIIKYFR